MKLLLTALLLGAAVPASAAELRSADGNQFSLIGGVAATMGRPLELAPAPEPLIASHRTRRPRRAAPAPASVEPETYRDAVADFKPAPPATLQQWFTALLRRLPSPSELLKYLTGR